MKRTASRDEAAPKLYIGRAGPPSWSLVVVEPGRDVEDDHDEDDDDHDVVLPAFRDSKGGERDARDNHGDKADTRHLGEEEEEPQHPKTHRRTTAC